MPEPWTCKLCPNYPFCSSYRGEKAMVENPCPYEVLNGLPIYETCKAPLTKSVNGKVEKPTAPTIIVERLK